MNVEILSEDAWVSHPGILIALWTDAAHAYALLQPAALVAVALVDGAYPALSPRKPGAAWFERLARDLTGHVALRAADPRPAIEQFRAPDGTAAWPEFALPEGEGVHQLGAGPVHGEITEPAHYRFSCIGERVLKLEIRLGYAHRDILAMIRGKSPRVAARFAARVAGDATVSHSLAFAHAAEAALQINPPPRAKILRAVMAEIERCANHVGDLGAIAAFAGFAVLEARFAAQREALAAASFAAFGHRLMMDAIIPGGIADDIRSEGHGAILGAVENLETALPGLCRMFEESGSLQDRLFETGVIPPDLVAIFGAGGPVGRAAGRREDARRMPGYAPYDRLDWDIPVAAGSDVAARMRIRFAELAASARLIRAMLGELPEGAIAVAPPAGSGMGFGVAESFRGPVWYWLMISSGAITDVFIADPSTLHWPLLECAAAQGDLSDFPLFERSINPSCAAVDL